MRQFKEHFERINNDYFYSGECYSYVGGEKTCKKVGRVTVSLDVALVLFLILSGLSLAGSLAERWYIVLFYMLEVIFACLLIRDSIRLLGDKADLKEPTVNKIIPSLKILSLLYAVSSLAGLLSVIINLANIGMYFYGGAYLVIKCLSVALSFVIFFFFRSISVTLNND